ncbi:MAG: OadG family transporter subunit [Bacteroides sp.]
MKTRNIGILIAMLFVGSLNLHAQGTKSLRINEVLITNNDNYEDDYGKHSAWIEIYNTAFSSANLKSCYLTNDKNNPKKYSIPKADVLTLIAPRQHTLFWADNQPNRGTFHLNFELDSLKANWIGLYDANGKTLIDSVTVPAGIPANFSWAREADGSSNWVIKGGDNENYVTPSTNNQTLDKNTKIDGFRKHDSAGIGMAIIAMSIVFLGLILLYISFKIIGNIARKLNKRNAMKAHGITDKKEAEEKSIGSESGEVFAAIAMAMHEYQDDIHDVEDTILTINKVKRNYSPWSSKIYMLRDMPRKH